MFLLVSPISGALLLVLCLVRTSGNGFQERCPKCQSAWDTEDPLTNRWKDTSIKLYFKERCIFDIMVGTTLLDLLNRMD